MKINWKKNISKSLLVDKCFLHVSGLAHFFLTGSFLFFFLFIFVKAIQGISHYGFAKIFSSLSFNLSAKDSSVSFWSPLFITAILAVMVIVLSIPFAIKCSSWLMFTQKHKTAKVINFLIELLSNLPSIIFGLFSRYYIAPSINTIFSVNSMNIMIAIITLCFMCTPVVVSIINKSLKNNKYLVAGALSLGVCKRHAIYKIAIPTIKKTIALSITIVFGKVISEGIALNFLLTSEDYLGVFKNGFLSIFQSQLIPVAPLISDNFFADGTDENGKNLLFTFSFLLLCFSYLFNNIIMRKFLKNNNKQSILGRYIKKFLMVVPVNYIFQLIFNYEIDEKKFTYSYIKNKLLEKWTRITFFNKNNFSKKYVLLSAYIEKRYEQDWNKKFFKIWKKSWEMISVFIISIFSITIVSVLVIKGIMSFEGTSFKNITHSGIFRALANSISVGIISIYLSVPLSLLSAIYLSEYCKSNLIKKQSLLIYNIASSTPSIIFGIFGSFFFISILGLTVNGTTGKSLLASILIISLFISCHLVRVFYNAFQSVSEDSKKASYALGMNKYNTFFSVILPPIRGDIHSAILANVGKILGETAPFILTAGISATTVTHLMFPGQTLTTRIYAELIGNHDMKDSSNNMFQSAFFLLILMTMITVIIRFVIPSRHKKNI